MQRRLQPGHVGVTGICRHFAARPVLACQAGIVEAVVGLCAQRLDHCQGRDAQAQGSVNRPVHPAGIRIHHALRGHAHALLIETMRGGIEVLNRRHSGACGLSAEGLWLVSGCAACGSPSLLAFSTVGAKSCGLAHSGSAGFEGRMGAADAAGACARMRSICSLKFSPRALRPMTCPPRRESCSIWLARKPSRGLACRLCPGRISGLLKDGINYS